ncbi:vq motif-containing protein 9 [Quercus suber]|uniref:Vq motif-containing protein 9 n=1 Tax=Quercus suber TaxID=58331 RepID=A0AAW0J9R7_QUESU
MRYLQNPIPGVDSNPKQFSGFSPLAPRFSPRWNTVTPPQPQLQHQFPPPPQSQQHQGMLPPPPPATMASQSQSQFLMPTSPLPFGCLNSPRSPYPLLSPSLLFSPSSGQLGLVLEFEETEKRRGGGQESQAWTTAYEFLNG